MNTITIHREDEIDATGRRTVVITIGGVGHPERPHEAEYGLKVVTPHKLVDLIPPGAWDVTFRPRTVASLVQ